MSAPRKPVTGGGCAITLSCEIPSSGAFGLSPRGTVLAREPAEQRGGNLSDMTPPADTL